jgi:hypothetical protein
MKPLEQWFPTGVPQHIRVAQGGRGAANYQMLWTLSLFEHLGCLQILKLQGGLKRKSSKYSALEDYFHFNFLFSDLIWVLTKKSYELKNVIAYI